MKIATWNIFCLPWWRTFGQSSPESRIDEIIEILLDLNLDIICLQEVLTKYIANQLEKKLREKGYYVIKNLNSEKEWGFRNLFEPESYKSGLFIALKFKPLEYEFIKYNASTGLDSLISKGFSKIKIKESIYIYLTHMQAGDNSTEKKKRGEQIEQLLQSLDKDTKNIIIGDFNILSNTDEYNNMIARLSKNNKLVYFDDNEDHIMFLNFNEKNIYRFKTYDYDKLSDHKLLVCNTTIQEKEKLEKMRIN